MIKLLNKYLPFRSCTRIIPGILLFLIFSGCASDKKKIPDLTWPPPPDIPRIRYIKSIYGTGDFEKSFFEKIGEWITGKKPELFLFKPYGVSVDRKGKIYIADSGHGRVLCLDLEEEEYKLFGDKGRIKLRMPVGVFVDRMENVYVSDVLLDKVIVYNRIGETILVLGKKGEFDNPCGIFVSEKNNMLYIVDTRHHCVKVYFKDGLLHKVIGKRGSGDGEFNFPTNIWIDNDGKIYVTDTLNFRVQIFDRYGEFIEKFGKLGSRYGSFTKPKGIALDSDGQIYIADAELRNFQIFNTEKHLLTHVGSTGKKPGSFMLPAGMCIDKKDRIYVVDQLNQRVDVFQYIKQFQ